MACTEGAAARTLAIGLVLMAVAVGQGAAAAEAPIRETAKPWHLGGSDHPDWMQSLTPAATGPALSAHQTAFEIGPRWQVRPNLALQPLLQRIRQPGGPAITGLGVRIEWALPGN